MNENIKVFLYGIWTLTILIISVIFLDYYIDKYNNVNIVLIWAFALLSGIYIESYFTKRN